MPEKGYVYILTNPSFKDNWIKIGKSYKLPQIRGKELDNTSIPLPFEVYAAIHTSKFNEVETMIHGIIDCVSKLRINKKREFFNLSPEKAFEILDYVQSVLGDEAKVELFGDNIEVVQSLENGQRVRGERFDFAKKGIKQGDVIEFIPDPTITAIVRGKRVVWFEDKEWYLSPLVRELMDRRNQVSSSGAYQGPAYFAFKGEKLIDIPNTDQNETDNINVDLLR